MFFKKKVKTKKEQEVFDIINGMCQVPSTEVRIDPMTMEFFLSLKEDHYDIIISNSTVVITNSKFSLRKDSLKLEKMTRNFFAFSCFLAMLAKKA